ncbi:MAG: sigma 54-interacting transcriptional regulator [bacterium]
MISDTAGRSQDPRKETLDAPADSPGEAAADPSAALVASLVVVWSNNEPHRVGEVIFIGGRRGDKPGVIGRFDADFDYAGHDVLAPARVRPGDLRVGLPLEMPAYVSRVQLELQAAPAAGIRVRNAGKARVRINTERELARGESTVLEPGETISIGDSALFLSTPRPSRLDAPRFYPAGRAARFGSPDDDGIVGESPAAWALRDRIGFAGQVTQHVVVHGPSGSGKELTALAIHNISPRARRAVVAQNASGIPPSLIEAELFGNRQDYPNPGTPERRGLIGEAHGSTLFLDELGQLPIELQGKLLRVLDDGGEYRRLGVDEALASDFRLVAATNRPLSEIKEDLLARLKVSLAVTGLNTRREDIPLFVVHLLRTMARRDGEKSVVERFTEAPATSGAYRVSLELIDALLRHDYTTNMRELERLLLIALFSSTADRIELTPDLRKELRLPGGRTKSRTLAAKAAPEETSCDAVRAALDASGWNVTAAAATFGWSRFQMHRKMKACGLAPGEDAAT